jgi:5-formyltetrahydrofolate cyclo-ligase
MTDSSTNFPERKVLREQLRNHRRALSPQQQQQASLGALRQLMTQPIFMRSHHVALYMAADGELDPQPIAAQLWKMKKHCYLPVLHPTKPGELWFIRYETDTPLLPNRFGIPEPDPFHNHQLPANLLDVALLPLVGFDRTGARLGMGAGFYDRTFAFKQHKPKGRPYLVGLAHGCQEVDSLSSANWDIPLYGIATEREMIKATRPEGH